MKKFLQSILCVSLLFLSFSAYAQPANDDCANATAVMEGMGQAFTTVDATSDGATHAMDCESGGSTPDSTYNDVWYTYTASFTGEAEWSFCGTADFDTKIYVYGPGSACPPQDADIVGCNEDAAGCANSTSIAIFDVTMGETYTLRVGGYGDGGPGESGSGTFSLVEFISNAPDNDDCVDAIEIFAGEDQAVTNVDATTDGPEHPGNPCFGFGDNTVQADIWFTYTSDFDGFLEWSTCDEVNFDSRLAVYTGSCPFTDADLYSCNDDGQGCAAYTSSLNFPVETGVTYYLRLGGYNAGMGLGTMDLVEIVPPPPPANDQCIDAELVTVVNPQQADNGMGEVSGTNLNAGFDGSSFLFPKCIANTNGGEFAEVWYKFDPVGLEEIEVRFLTLQPTDASFYFDLWEDCDSLAFAPVTDDCFFVDGSDGINNILDTILNIPITQTEYYIRVTTRLTSDIPGDFIFQLVGDIVDNVNELDLTEFNFYPNPVTDVAQLDFELPSSKDIQVEIIDILGQRVHFEDKGTLPSGEHNISFNLNDYAQGIYFLSVRSEDQVKSIKFVKE